MCVLADVVQINTGAVALLIAIPSAAYVLVKIGDRLWKSEPKESGCRPQQSLECQYDHAAMHEAVMALTRSNEKLQEAMTQVLTTTNATQRDVQQIARDHR